MALSMHFAAIRIDVVPLYPVLKKKKKKDDITMSQQKDNFKRTCKIERFKKH